ncbi:MAG TPA: hypothetical protein VES92_06190 [Nitrospiraceae bacterium]|nr:hypothetical protein [Nitrospiraceae bacterium]
MILDCSSRQSTQLSLGQILDISSTHLLEALSHFNLDQFCVEHQSDDRKPGVILLEEVFNVAAHARIPESISWFHGTRVINPGSFRSNGIRPLSKQLDQIWIDLFSIAGHYVNQQEWETFRRAVETTHPSHSANLYRMKTRDILHWGPHAVLVRDVLVNPERFESVDYLNTPEIVEDISLCFHERHGRDLLPAFQQQSYACIVKFNDNTPRPDSVPIALHYLYCITQNRDLFPGCNTCFDGNGHLIQPHQTIEIEVIS